MLQGYFMYVNASSCFKSVLKRFWVRRSCDFCSEKSIQLGINYCFQYHTLFVTLKAPEERFTECVVFHFLNSAKNRPRKAAEMFVECCKNDFGRQLSRTCKFRFSLAESFWTVVIFVMSSKNYFRIRSLYWSQMVDSLYVKGWFSIRSYGLTINN